MTNIIKESERVRILSEYNLDYNALRSSFDDLTQLAAKFAGTDISLINLLDSYQQWTVGQHGIATEHIAKEDSICQYTILEEGNFLEIKDLSKDERFKMRGNMPFRYYYGIPIRTETGHCLGALCVVDKTEKTITAEKNELLQLIAKEVVNRLNLFKQSEILQTRIHALINARRLLAHDIRGPLTGIIGLAQLGVGEISAEVHPYVNEYFSLILESGTTAVSMVEDILTAGKYNEQDPGNSLYDITILKKKIEDLFMPQVRKKNLLLDIQIPEHKKDYKFFKGQILQIICNLVANGIKFTRPGGTVRVNLAINLDAKPRLDITVTDTGTGMTAQQIASVLEGTALSTAGTDGEIGFGIGMSLVKQLVAQAKGRMTIDSSPEGSVFQINIPL